jgi:hypothetical protein
MKLPFTFITVISHWPLPAVRDLTRDGRWSTYDVSVLKLSNVSFRGKCASMRNTLKISSPTKLARLGHFPPTSQAGRLAGQVFDVYVFSLITVLSSSVHEHTRTSLLSCVSHIMSVSQFYFTFERFFLIWLIHLVYLVVDQLVGGGEGGVRYGQD